MIAPDTTPEAREALNRAAREQMKLKILADIRVDMLVCELEGWDQLEYLREIRDLINHFFKDRYVEKNR